MTDRFTADDIVREIDRLPKARRYEYISPKNKGNIEVLSVDKPDGPIHIRRWDTSKGKTRGSAKTQSISRQMIWRIANALRPGHPINFDRVLGASYNTRSVLETLLAHTPEFSFCYPGRIMDVSGRVEIKRGHKHIIWLPESPHSLGILHEVETNVAVSEIPSTDVVYEALTIPADAPDTTLDPAIRRRHAQIQVALVLIGRQLGFKTWVAANDRGIVYNKKKLGEVEGVIASLPDVQQMGAYRDAINVAMRIDCIWFKNARLMPAVMEIEHTTGVTSGLTRMKKFYDLFPPIPTRYAIVAPDEDRSRVLKEASNVQFKPLSVKFFPYSAVEELLSLCERRRVSSSTVDDRFLDGYMELANT